MSITQLQGQPLGDGMLHPPGSLADPQVAELTAFYKRAIASRYKALRGDELDQLSDGTTHFSPKIDGELWYLWRHPDGVALVANNGRVITGDIPVLAEAAKTFGARAEVGTLLAGELFAVGGRGRPRVGDVGSALGSNGDPKRLGFQAFDLAQGPNLERPPELYADRLAVVQKLLEGGKRCQPIKTEVGPAGDAPKHYEAWVASGKAEGLVARTADGRVHKVKPVFSLDAVVLGYTVRAEDPTQTRSMLLGLERPDGTIQVVGNVGNLGSDDKRRELHQVLEPTILESRFRIAHRTGAMYHLVKPTMVVEVQCTDVQPESGDGTPVRQWALRLDDTEGWVPMTRVHGAALLHPVLIRVRDDKQPHGTDIRIDQLLERCLVHAIDEVAESVDLPKSTLLRREVWSKHTKGELAGVRKLVVWQTNKSEADPSYPAFVVHWTDYSANRKQPLQRKVKQAPTLELATAIADDLVTGNIKRGWNPVEA